jgi:hypothetical protein
MANAAKRPHCDSKSCTLENDLTNTACYDTSIKH